MSVVNDTWHLVTFEDGKGGCLGFAVVQGDDDASACARVNELGLGEAVKAVAKVHIMPLPGVLGSPPALAQDRVITTAHELKKLLDPWLRGPRPRAHRHAR
jgi:hypothetical protein